jgi:hypothetical protein
MYPERKKRIGTRVLTCLKHEFTYVLVLALDLTRPSKFELNKKV